MRRFLASLALLTALNPVIAQERHFVYLQADHEQAFYLRTSGETRSSTPAGYLILSRLTEPALEFVVGFPMRKYPEYSFRIEGLGRDRGYALKDFGEKGWGLFDMQSMEVSMGKPMVQGSPDPLLRPIKAVRDSFASVLASVVGDSAIMDASLIVRKSDIETGKVPASGVTTDSLRTAAAIVTTGAKARPSDTALSVAGKEAGNASVGKADPSSGSVPSAAERPLPALSKGRDTVSATKPDTVGMVRLKLPDPVRKDPNAAGQDPPTVPIRNDSSGAALRPDTSVVRQPTRPPGPSTGSNPSGTAPTAAKPVSSATSVRETLKLLEYADSSGTQLVFSDRDEHGRLDTVSLWIPASSSQPGNPSDREGGNARKGSASRPERTDCAGMVSVGELGQLRRRMEAIPDEDAKVAAALKEFRLRCFTTEQVRSLLVVFFREEGRYKLLDAAYARVFDPMAFLELEQVLKDPYFIHRFRRLVGLQ